MLSFIQYLNESIRSAQEGESEIVHHLTPTKFSKFHHMSHFGTKQAAREAIKNKDEYFDKIQKYFCKVDFVFLYLSYLL